MNFIIIIQKFSDQGQKIMQSNQRIQTERMTNEGVDIVFQSINYNVEVEKKTEEFKLPCNKEYQIKNILKNVSGMAKAGEVTAIMGASGAGKTTLLNVLACRIPRAENEVGHASGKIYANELQYKFEEFGEFANYVMQDDILLQTLTVRETIQYVAQLKLNKTEEERDENVTTLIKNLKLEKCEETLVGGKLIKGISGGERKRTSIAFQLVSNPSVILLDEPTSGLDSLTAFIICSYLKKLAKDQNKTVIMTIHQPSSELFDLFDRLILMAQGRMVYQGKAQDSIQYFTNMNFNCPEFSNPPDYFMSILHHESAENVENYPKYFQTYQKQIQPHVKKQIQAKHSNVPPRKSIQIPFCQGLSALLKKDWKNTVRNPMVVKTRIIQSIFISLFVGGLYFNLPQDIESNSSDPNVMRLYFQSITGFFYFMCIMSLMTSLTPVTLVFPQERLTFLKEESSRLYNTGTFYLSKNLIQFPFMFLLPMLMAVILYWMVGLDETAEQFFTFYLALFLIGLAGNSLGYLLGSLTSDTKIVTLLIPVMIMPFVLFSGFYKNRDSLPVWLGWIQYLSPIKYGFIILTKNEVIEDNQQDLLDTLNFDVSLWNSVYILLAICIVLRAFSLLFLYLGRKKLQ